MKFRAAIIALFVSGCAPEVTPELVAAYLEADTAQYQAKRGRGRTLPHPPVFVHRPTVHLLRGATENQAEVVGKAVAVINAMLPGAERGDFDPTARVIYGYGNWRDGRVYIGFRPYADWPGLARDDSDPHSELILGVAIPKTEPNKPERIIGGLVLIDPDRVARSRNNTLLSVVFHEFLHLAGRGHPKDRRFYYSIMNSEAPLRPSPHLYPLDIAAFKTLYSKLGPASDYGRPLLAN